MIHDPDNGWVVLDKAMDQGLMGYPDILGREVTVHVEPEVAGKVVAVGPLGFVVEVVTSDLRNEHGRMRPTTVARHRMFAWGGVSVSWTVADAVDRVAEIYAASGRILDAIGRELGVLRDSLDPSDEAYQIRLLEALRSEDADG